MADTHALERLKNLDIQPDLGYLVVHDLLGHGKEVVMVHVVAGQ